MHRSRFALFAASALLAAPAGASEFAADTVVLDDIIGALAITTGEGEAVTIDIDPGAGVVEPPEVTERDGVVSVFGPALHVRECRGGDGEPELGLPGGGRAPLSDFPRVSITAPRDVTVILRDVLVFGEVGDVAAAEVSASGCGELVFGNIAGAAQLRLRG
ncbi:MAG: hypothetical protein MI723_09715, partial [Caulobacterales bacterium]|nr:hypothetical protein [Caulobacterales bacterium]